MALIQSAELVHMVFRRPFETASGRTLEKQSVILRYDDGTTWELTWSPSMGVSPLRLYNAMQSFGSDERIQSFIESHLRWKCYLDKRGGEPIISSSWLAAEEVGVGYSDFSCREGIDLLRVKCRGVVPEWMYGHQLPKVAILDFNGSANLLELEHDLKRLAALHSETRFYLEEPCFKRGLHSLEHVSEILDRAGYSKSMCAAALDHDAVATIKFGRNSVEEYERLFLSGVGITFGTVLCSKSAYEQVCGANEKLGTFLVRVVRRDGLNIESAANPQIEILSSETHIADSWQALAQFDSTLRIGSIP